MLRRETAQKAIICILLAVLLIALVAASAVAGLHMPAQTAYADGDYGLRRVTADMLQPTDGHPQAENFPDFRQTLPSQYDPLGRAKSIETGKKCFVISDIYTIEDEWPYRFCYKVYENGAAIEGMAGCYYDNSFILEYVNNPDYLVYYTSTPVHSHNIRL